jgi:4-amino-4-deoxy-L-arabinose transferase-like glycosyltransferase
MLLVFGFVLSVGALFWVEHVGGLETSWNAATYVYVGKTILAGGMPYRDAYDVKGPGIYYLFALALFPFGASLVGIQLLDATWQALTALVLYRVGVRIYRSEAAGILAGLLYVIYQLAFVTRGGTAEPDRLVALPIGLGVLCLLDARADDRYRSWILAGVTMSAAALLKLPAALFGIVMLGIATAARPVRVDRIVARVAALAAGFLAPILACVLWFHLRGALGDLVDAQFELAPRYLRAFSAWRSPACLRMEFVRAFHLPLYALGGLGIVYALLRRRQALQWPEWLVVAWLLVAAASLLLHGLFFPYHFVPLAAPLALLGGRAIAGWREQSTGLRAVAVLAGALFLALPVVKVPRVLVSGPRDEGASNDVWRTLAASLRARMTAGDTVFLWANAPQFYLDMGRPSPSRFFHSIYLSSEWLESDTHPQFLADLAAQPPRFFVVSRSGATGGPCPFNHVDYYGAFLRFTALQRFLAARYVVEEETARYTLYRRKDTTSA